MFPVFPSSPWNSLEPTIGSTASSRKRSQVIPLVGTIHSYFRSEIQFWSTKFLFLAVDNKLQIITDYVTYIYNLPLIT
jgi:hypothetical protein